MQISQFRGADSNARKRIGLRISSRFAISMTGAVMAKNPLHFLPTCIGCSKRWACNQEKISNAQDE